MESRELDPEDSDTMITDAELAGEQVRLIVTQLILRLIQVKEEVMAIWDGGQVNPTTTSSKPIVANQMAGADPSTTGYDPRSFPFHQVADGIVSFPIYQRPCDGQRAHSRTCFCAGHRRNRHQENGHELRCNSTRGLERGACSQRCRVGAEAQHEIPIVRRYARPPP